MFGGQRIDDAPWPIPPCPKCGKSNTVVPLHAVRLREGAHCYACKGCGHVFGACADRGGPAIGTGYLGPAIRCGYLDKFVPLSLQSGRPCRFAETRAATASASTK
jgi:hypothetical protein